MPFICPHITHSAAAVYTGLFHTFPQIHNPYYYHYYIYYIYQNQ